MPLIGSVTHHGFSVFIFFSLYCLGDGLSEAKDALLRIGAQSPLSPGPNGSVAFLGYTGPQDVDWLKQSCHSRGQGPSQITDYYVLVPAAVDELFKESEDDDGVGGDDQDEDSSTSSYEPDVGVERARPSSSEEEVKHSARVSKHGKFRCGGEFFFSFEPLRSEMFSLPTFHTKKVDIEKLKRYYWTLV